MHQTCRVGNSEHLTLFMCPVVQSDTPKINSLRMAKKLFIYEVSQACTKIKVIGKYRKYNNLFNTRKKGDDWCYFSESDRMRDSVLVRSTRCVDEMADGRS